MKFAQVVSRFGVYRYRTACSDSAEDASADLLYSDRAIAMQKPTRPSSLIFLLPALPLLCAACQPAEPQRTYTQSQLREVLRDPPRQTEQTSRRRDHWSIALATFSMQDHRAGAEEMQTLLAQEHGLTNTYITSDQSRSVLYYGSYRSHDDRRLQADLARVKNLVIDGGQPFLTAFLVPPDTLDIGSDSPLSLTSVRRRYGPAARLYTLEVGVYEDQNRRAAMAAAEEAVRVYRSQGEEAYFYHGPHRSSVTIGVLSEAQLDFEAPGFGPAVRELRLRHPHRAVNGSLVRVREAGQDRGIAPSTLMIVP